MTGSGLRASVLRSQLETRNEHFSQLIDTQVVCVHAATSYAL
jgi:hypothetical protein